MALRTLDSLGPLEGRRVLLRADLNVPLHDGRIGDDGRIRATVPTIRMLTERGAAVVVCSHLGRPAGSPDPQFSLAPVARRLEELLGAPVAFASDTVGPAAAAMIDALAPGAVGMLENLRFEPGEASKDGAEREDFARRLAEPVDALVSDGFGVVHRKQASVYELARILPSAAGLLVAAEVEILHRLTTDPTRPYTVVLGGSKVSDKLGVIENLLPRVDTLIIGGGMMFTFLAAQGHAVGASLLEAGQIDAVRRNIEEARRRGVRLLLPSDAVMAASFAADAAHTVADVDALERTPFGAFGMGLDIGPKSAAAFADVIRSSATVFWNGPMGVFEMPAFAAGTRAVAEAMTAVKGLSVIGGGDSAAAVRSLGFSDDQFGHISTGGGASLEFLEGATLPGLEVLGWQP
jgi:phosphoglycerate kinase